MKRLGIAVCVAVLVLSVLPVAKAQTVPPGFTVTQLATGLASPKGIVSAHHRAGAGPFGHDLYVAESGANRIVTVDKKGTGASTFASNPAVPPLSFPVGVAFSGGPFGKYLYVGNAFGGGIVQIDTTGNISPFALPGLGIAGLDFGRGAYGHDLYAGEWTAGNIWQIDPAGNATLFINVPGTDPRYLKFSHGGTFGTYLYFTDFATGDIYQVAPDGTATPFAITGSPCLEGLDFSPGGAFGHYLYAGDVCTGDIFQVAPDGTWVLWASGFGGAADIHFEPGKRGGFTMYMVDGQFPGSVYAIHK